ncbi:MAG: hypothetical protein GY942_01085 [Aestuariibacter sp.]|nr:hypothetical protein [Aestuariibacter sp.]
MITVDLWMLLTFFVGLLIVFFGACAAAGRMLLAQFQTHMDARFTAADEKLASIDASNKEEAAQWKQLERDFMTWKADLPLNYVRREDYTRGQSVIEAKLDGLASRIEAAQLRGLLGVKNDVN